GLAERLAQGIRGAEDPRRLLGRPGGKRRACKLERPARVVAIAHRPRDLEAPSCEGHRIARLPPLERDRRERCEGPGERVAVAAGLRDVDRLLQLLVRAPELTV